MQIKVNDELRQVPRNLKIEQLLKNDGLGEEFCAVALNGVFLPKAKHIETFLQEGDLVEIVSPREGG